MKSIEKIKTETGLNNLEILYMFRDVCKHYLCDEDIEPFLVKAAEKKINLYFCTRMTKKVRIRESNHKNAKRKFVSF
jgi:hypothetical protein